MALKKMVNGVEIEMTPEEEAAFEAGRAPSLALSKATLIEAVDTKIAGIYNRWLRFEAEYVAREAAARAFKAAGYVGDPGVWVTSFSSNTGMSNTAAANLIIGQADGLRTALQALGALRMAKYGIQAAGTVAGAYGAYDSIIAQADAIAAAL